MLERMDRDRERKRKYWHVNTKDKDLKICENLRATKGDPNSLLLNEKFVEKMLKRGVLVIKDEGKNYVKNDKDNRQ